MDKRANTRWRANVDRSAPRRPPKEGGFVTAEFIGAMGFLFLPVAIMVMTFPTWSERQSMALVAAREAARTYVVTGDEAAAQQVVTNISNNYHLPDDGMELVLQGSPRQRGGNVVATIAVKIPFLHLPLLDINSTAFTLHESHTEVVDLFRSQAP